MHDDQRRQLVLVEDPDPAWQDLVKGMLDPECYVVDVCPGPGGLADGCPVLAHQTCPKAEWADIILSSLPLDRYENVVVSDALRQRYPDKFAVLEGEPPGMVHAQA